LFILGSTEDAVPDLPHPELVEGRTIELPRAEQRAL
jgi:hypothetical protein